MKIKHLRWLFLGLLSVMLIGSIVLSLSNTDPISFGISAGWTNGRYSYSAGTSPLVMCFGFAINCFYLLLVTAEPPSLGGPFRGVARRFFAFWIDFVLGLCATTPFAAIFPVLMEWRRTQQFHWSFARETPAPGDSWIASISLFFAFAFMILFCAIPLIRRVPSPGACILGYQIIRDDGQAMTLRNALLRTFLGFIAAAACYLAPFLFRDRKAGKF